MSHSESLFRMVSENSKAEIEVLCYSQQQPGEVNEDRIHLLVTDQDGNKRGWLMTPGEARCIITGLDMAIEKAVEYGILED